MKNHRAIPEGFMTVGEVAKKMNTTVFAIQYYDKKNILKPSGKTEGGRRLYTDEDIFKLHQIQTMKYLGFSLDDIRTRILLFETQDEVVEALTEQANIANKKMADLSKVLQTIEALKTEVLQMQTVDFKKYADIVINLQMENEHYKFIKYLDDKILNYFRNRFDKDRATEMLKSINFLMDEALRLRNDGINPESDEGQAFARAYWEKMLEFVDGDVSVILEIFKFTDSISGDNSEWKKKEELASSFIEPALGAYFAQLGVNPFGKDRAEYKEENI